jgi:hypothetical protein
MSGVNPFTLETTNMSKNDETKKGVFNDAFALWNGRGKVAYSTYAKEDITIPAGAKILAFRVADSTVENRKPSIKIVWVIEDKE